ncbi:hypothetical protein [Pseudoalteromonas xiamenensis]
MASSLSFEVSPNANGEMWAITGTDGKTGEEVKIQLSKEMSTVNLYYQISSQSALLGWQFADNGTLFVNAQDNFNYQVNSIVANEGKSMIVSITSIESCKTIPDKTAEKMAKNPTKPYRVVLEDNNNFEIAFRLIAKIVPPEKPEKPKKPKKDVRYFSQDPKVIIEDLDPI